MPPATGAAGPRGRGWRGSPDSARGLLTSAFAAEHSRSYNAATLAQRLAEHPDQRVIADRLVPADYQADWARPRRAVTPKRSGVSTL